MTHVRQVTQDMMMTQVRVLTHVGHLTHHVFMTELMNEEQDELPIGIPILTLGWRLQMAMARGGRSREYMAARCGVAPGTITRWLHDQGVRPPRKGDLQIFADEGRVPIGWLQAAIGGGDPAIVVTGQYLAPFLRLLPGEGDTSPPMRQLAAVS